MTDRVGQQLGNYQLLKLIGRGGFAEVYLGEHVRLGNQVAVKVLHTRLADEDRENFQREARTIGRLAHPNIVRVYDFAVQDGVPFLAMDYAPNGTLRQRHAKGAALAVTTILPYVKQVADALQYAHEQKLIHRDIKPENMLLGPLNDVLLSDFGIALVAQSSRYQTSQEMVGTVGYMAPEQIQGQPRPASDQYSLGVVVYEWLTGGRPFQGGITEVATQQLVLAPPPLRAKVPSISPAVEEVVMTALAKDPNQRFGSVRAFAAALENAALGEQPRSGLAMPPDLSAAPPLPAPPGSGPSSLTPPGAPSGAGAAFPPAALSLPFAPTLVNSAPLAAPSLPFAPTVADSAPPGLGWGNPSTLPNAPSYGSGPQGVGSGAPMMAPPGRSAPVGYPPPSGPQTPLAAPSLIPPVIPATKPGRRFPLWLVIVLVMALALGGGGGVVAFILLTQPEPVISVTSSYHGAVLGGPADTVLHITGQKFSANSSITLLLDGAPAPGAPVITSDANGAFSANVTITDDWTISAHTLTAKDSQDYVTKSDVSIRVLAQPVLAVVSPYKLDTTPAGSTTTSFTVTGKRFSPNATVTFLLDGSPAPGSQSAQSDARGRVQATLTVTSGWRIGNHTLGARDSDGYTTQAEAPVAIVHQGEANTPGPNGAPPDDATFSLNVVVQVRDDVTGKALQNLTFTLNVNNGVVCDNQNDTGQPQNFSYKFSNGEGYQETYTWTCSGAYKGGMLTYTETDTQDVFHLSDGGLCVATTPRVNKFLQGSFSSATSIAGAFKADAERISCPRINTFYLVSSNAGVGSWTGAPL